jgi:hypothetical protein
MQTKSTSLAAIMVLDVLLTGVLAGGILGPGKYSGVVVVDRWGQKLLQCGSTAVFLADDVYEKLKDQAGKPIEITVTEMDQPKNPGGAMVKAFSKWVPYAPKTPLELQVKAKTTKVRPGLGLTVEVQVSNPTRKDVVAFGDCFEVILVSSKPVEVPSWKDPQQRAYWYYTEGYSDGHVSRHSFGHPHDLAWTAAVMAKSGSGISVTPNSDNRNATLSPGAQFAAAAIIARELPSGQYQAFAMYRGDFGASTPGISPRIDFEVMAEVPSTTATAPATLP